MADTPEMEPWGEGGGGMEYDTVMHVPCDGQKQ